MGCDAGDDHETIGVPGMIKKKACEVNCTQQLFNNNNRNDI